MTAPVSPVSAEELKRLAEEAGFDISGKEITIEDFICTEEVAKLVELVRSGRATAPSGAKAPGWLPIETAPKNGAGFIARSGYRYDNEVFYCVWDIKEGHFVKPECNEDIWCNPTHWTPLLAPPDPNHSEEQ